MIKNFHPADLWQNETLLGLVQSHRNIKTFHGEGYSIFFYTLGPVTLKTKVFVSHNFIESSTASLARKLSDFNAFQIELYCHNDQVFDGFFKNYTTERLATYIVDLTLPAEILFKNISRRRRSQIRKGIREGVDISQEVDSKNFAKWWEMYLSTSKRSGFTIQKKSLVWDALQLPECRLFTAWRNETLLAGNIIFTHNFPFYWLGSSNIEYSKLNAPAILHWNIIEYYQKKRGKLYDLNGAVFDQSHGPTRFKKSLGGIFIEYKKLYMTPNPWVSSLVKLGAKFNYNYLKRSTW